MQSTADPDPVSYPARASGSDAGSTAALQRKHRRRRPGRRSQLLRDGVEPPGRGIPETRRTGPGGGAAVGSLPDPQAEPSSVGFLVSESGAVAAGGGGPDLGGGADGPRGGTFGAAGGRDSDVGHLPLPGKSADGARAVARCDGGPANRSPAGARVAVEYAARRCFADRNRRLAGTGSFGPGGGGQQAVPGDGRIGVDPGDVRGGRGKSGRQPARRAVARAHGRPFPIAGPLFGNARAGATRPRARLSPGGQCETG